MQPGNTRCGEIQLIVSVKLSYAPSFIGAFSFASLLTLEQNIHYRAHLLLILRDLTIWLPRTAGRLIRISLATTVASTQICLCESNGVYESTLNLLQALFEREENDPIPLEVGSERMRSSNLDCLEGSDHVRKPLASLELLRLLETL